MRQGPGDRCGDHGAGVAQDRRGGGELSHPRSRRSLPLEEPATRYDIEYAAEDISFPHEVAIAPLDGDDRRIFEVEVVSLDAFGRLVAEARLRSGYVPMKTVRFPLRLSDRCRGLSCERHESCRVGRCENATVNPTVGLTDGELPDAGTDELPGSCSEDEDCDDRVVCNGAERCQEGRCVDGDRLACVDDVACTVDTCRESGCRFSPDDSACVAGAEGRCEDDGCQYTTCDESTCASEGCIDARCEGGRCVRSSRCEGSESCCGEACVPAGCDDGNPCTSNACVDGECVSVGLSGARCDDGDACTDGDVCSDGTCVGGRPATCPDSANPCVTVACSSTSGCVETVMADGVACSDGDACNGDEQCQAGACVAGMAVSCDDGVACTTDTCDPDTGDCGFTPDDALCTTDVGGRCDVANGCQYPLCNAANCTSTPSACEVAACVGDVCMRATTCDIDETCCGGTCVPAGCNDGNPCTSDSCGAAGCVNRPDDGRACQDGSACTTGDTCRSGACVAGSPLVCNDSNPCTTDTCSPSAGCVFTVRSNGSTCDDGSECTDDDTCMSGTCRPGSPTVCPVVECLTHTCIPDRGCVASPINDGIRCGQPPQQEEGCYGSICQDGECVAGDYADGTSCTPVCPYFCGGYTCIGGSCTPAWCE